ncbi:MAG: peptidoglycan DD-metalloendopeptidase family protein [Gemmatimonadota bacterium]
MHRNDDRRALLHRMAAGLLRNAAFVRLSRSCALPAALLLLAVPSGVSAQVADSAALELGRSLTQHFFDGNVESVAGALDDEMRTALGGAAELTAFRSQVFGQLGAEVEVLDERVTTSGVHRVYHRSARFDKIDAAIAVVWAFDADDRVAGFYIRPEEAAQQAARSNFLDYRTRTPLRLPFEDEFTVVWGGRTVEENYHAAHADQRFAYDLLVVEDGRSSYGGVDGTNEDYFCFGRIIVAPGAGVVATAVDGIPDNIPGEMNNEAPLGNHTVIDHGRDEYSFLAHFRNGSLRVSPGERVSAGTVLGECGNSGRSSEPHLHYHMQNTALFGRGEGLPTQFNDYLADSIFVSRGEPVRGERIGPAGGKPRD